MTNLASFERLVRRLRHVGSDVSEPNGVTHPFDERNIHPEIAAIARQLFDDGHYSQATFEAYKYLDHVVKTISGVDDTGHKLMMSAFNEKNPKIKLTTLATSSEIDEQLGYRFIFAGAMSAIRNPRGHDINADPIGRCLDHLSLASVLLRRIEEREGPLP